MPIEINGIVVNENDPILFLDIDGVLNYWGYRDELEKFTKAFSAKELVPPTLCLLDALRFEARFFSKKAINNLEEIVFSSKGWVVISSDRQNKLSVADLRYMFKDYRFSERIIDKTGEHEVTVGLGQGHGPNILEWQKRYPMFSRKLAFDDLNLEQDLGEYFIHCAKDDNSYALEDPRLVKISLEKLGVNPIGTVKDYSYLEEDAYKDLGSLDEFFTCIKNGDIESLLTKNYPEEYYQLREYDKTCLHIAVTEAQVDIVELLLKKGLSPNCIDSNFFTPLHELVLQLFKRKYFNEQGELHLKEILELLVDAGADFSRKNSYGRIPIDFVDTAFKERVQKVFDACLNKRLNSSNATQEPTPVLFQEDDVKNNNTTEVESAAYAFSLSGPKRKRNTDSAQEKSNVENNNNVTEEELIVKDLKL